MPRLHVARERLASGRVVLDADETRYLVRVLRLGAGDALVVFDGLGVEHDARIERVGPRAAELELVGERPAGPGGGLALWLVAGLPKGEKLDLVVQKATELGVSRVLPAATARAVPRLEGARAAARRVRWERIAREAARQAGRADVPVIDPVRPLDAALALAPDDAVKLLLWEEERAVGLRAALPAAAPATVVIAVGPEGGFTAAEVRAAAERGFCAVGLGPRILRAETAALAALAILAYALGDLG